MYLNLNDDQLVKSVCRKAFPEYTGRKVQIRYNVKSINLQSYWDGGSRSYFAIVRLQDNEILSVPENHPAFSPINGIDNFTIPEGYVVVENRIFCGRDMGLKLHVSESAPLLESGDNPGLTKNEKIVLYATSYKSSYAGISNYRYHEARRATGINSVDYETVKISLINKGLLDKRGAITNSGRNIKDTFGYNWPID